MKQWNIIKSLYFTYYENGDIKLYIGYIHYLDELKKEVRILGFHQEKYILKIEDILRIDIFNH
ncbi:YolD-like family protein [Bacillus sp. SA1-12]|uniref:YolD-like family protein n=1 Tax=Bacillus sp. SA1-12 TaxID=1455638 RepID=UPI000AC0E600